MKTVGVVIPIYNVEKYLRECLDSVINQSYTNLEIILVNDGSTDENSLNIAKEYTLKDERITLFDKKNGGLSSARNVGIEYFSGEYKLKNKTQSIKENSLIEFNIEGNNPYEIYTVYKSYKAFNNEKDLTKFTYPIIDYIIFLDSDDYWELNCIEECVPRMDGVEVLWFDHYFYYDEIRPPNTPDKTLVEKCKFKKSQKISSYDFLKALLNIKRQNFWFGWHGMIDFNYLKSIGLKFLNQVLHEDHYFGKLLFLQSNNIFVFTKKCLYYRIRVGSIMNRGGGVIYIPDYMLDEFNSFDQSAILYKQYHRKSSLFLTAMSVFQFTKENKIENETLFKNIFFKKLQFWRNDLLSLDNKYLSKILYFSFSRFFKLSNNINTNLLLIADFFSEIISNKDKTIQEKDIIINSNTNQIDQLQNNIKEKIKQLHILQNNIQKNSVQLNQLQSKLSFQTKYGTAKSRIQNQLSYKLGQAMIINSKNIFGILFMPVYIISTLLSHRQEKKIYQEKIKKDPSLKLPPLESYPDYKEALKEKECLTYKLGEALIKANKTWYKGGYVKLIFEIGKLKKEFKKRLTMLSQITLKDINDIAIKAGKSVLKIYNQDFKISYKDDNSPLSEADLISNEIICKELAKFSLPILSEENKTLPYEQRKDWEYFWCVDPIDGTKEFINKNGEFTINIALVCKDTPVLGVVYAPALELLYSAKKGEGAFKNSVKLPLQRNDDFFKIVASKSHLNEQTKDFIDSIQTTKQKEFVSMGSSLKLCLVASNEADIYPRLAPTMEWDTAAADAIVREVGKMTYDFDTQKPLVYNKENLLNPYFIVK